MTIWRYKTNTITSSLIGVTSRSFIENAVDEAVKNSFSSSINPSFLHTDRSWESKKWNLPTSRAF